MNFRLSIGAVASILAIGAAAPTAASAAEVFGSSAFATARTCSEPAGQACVIRPSTTEFSPHGLYETAEASFDLGNGSSSMVHVGFGDSYLPILKGAVTSSSDQRIGSNVMGFRSYTYQGDESIDLALAGNLHFVTSGNTGGMDAAGEGFLSAYLFVSKMDFMDTLNSGSNANQIFTCAFACGTRLADSFYESWGTTGENTVPLALSAVRLNPGDQFIVGATMQMFGNRGGYIDAFNTFTVNFDLDRTVLADGGTPVGADFLAQNITSAVPEPATWAMMITGFGLAGAVLRRRRPVPAIA